MEEVDPLFQALMNAITEAEQLAAKIINEQDKCQALTQIALVYATLLG